jgi:hypothetical protein
MNRPVCYQIRIRGRLGRTIRAAFPGLRAAEEGQDTLLTGDLTDQAALHGVLTQIEALGLELVEVRRLPVEALPLEAARTAAHHPAVTPPHPAAHQAEDD